MGDTLKNIPEVRFKGFDEEWTDCYLGDLGSVAMNKRIFKDQTTDEGDIPFYKIGTFGGKPNAFISRELFEDYKLKYPYPEKGDILISASGSIGRTVEYMGEEGYFQDSNIVWLKHGGKVVNSFLKQFYLIVKWNGLEGSTIKRLYNSNILNTAISLPKPDEQTKIGAQFKKLDQLISLRQQKLEKLKNLKKALLDKMFPSNGVTTPEIRFKGFTDNWEKKTLEEICENTYGGGTPKTSVSEYWNGDVPWIQSSDLTDAQLSEVVYRKEVSKKGIESSATKLIPANSVAIVTRVGVGKLAFIPYQYATSQDFLSLSKLTVDHWFGVYSIWKKLQSELHAVQGTSIKGITKEELLAKQIKVPDQPSEQAKIGSFFKKLDKQITLLGQELGKLKNIKKALLEKMFV